MVWICLQSSSAASSKSFYLYTISKGMSFTRRMRFDSPVSGTTVVFGQFVWVSYNVVGNELRTLELWLTEFSDALSLSSGRKLLDCSVVVPRVLSKSRDQWRKWELLKWRECDTKLTKEWNLYVYRHGILLLSCVGGYGLIHKSGGYKPHLE